MLVLFVHGWSVRTTDTYGYLPQWLETQGYRDPSAFGFRFGNIYLGRYISFDDNVTIDDVARAFNQALTDELTEKLAQGESFACITHSTGGPVVRKWMDLYYKENLRECPLKHLIMLAPANHGSALARLGKSRASRIITAERYGNEPGQRILDWLELGSSEGWELNTSWLDYNFLANGIYVFVLTGQKIDRRMYDAVNPYTAEPGSDGVIRVAAANANYDFIQLTQQPNGRLHVSKSKKTSPMVFGILPRCSHSGGTFGILGSIPYDPDAIHPTTTTVLKCLKVANQNDYITLGTELANLTTGTQDNERTEEKQGGFLSRTYITNEHSMIIFKLIDDRGNPVTDHDVYFTASVEYSPDELPTGFLRNCQQNKRTPEKTTYYLDYHKLDKELNGKGMERKFGLEIRGLPEKTDKALTYYETAIYHTDLDEIPRLLTPNQTTMVEIVLRRKVDKTVFKLTNELKPSVIDATPSDDTVA